MINNHKADSFDGGRGSSEPENPVYMSEPSLGSLVEAGAQSEDDDARALALAIMALGSINE